MGPEKQSKANVKQAVPFFNVSNMKESLRFYVDGLGFEIVHRWDVDGKLRWCWLRLDNAALMLQQFPTEGHGSWVPQCKVGEGVKIYFICDDALAIYDDVTARGLDASEPFVGNGMWVTSLDDPDGYGLSFESETDVPEETRLSDWRP